MGSIRPSLFALAASISFLLSLQGHACSMDAPICPDTSLGESAEDCPWAGVARELLDQINAGKPVAPKLAELLPTLQQNLTRDAAFTDWKTLWGQSINFDELAKGVIVHPEILGALQQNFGVPVADRIVHAGLEHTYGYLFSVLKTAFGYKRARWVRGTLEQGFELPAGLIGPTPQSGTLFGNATYFAGRIAFRDQPAELTAIKNGGDRVAPELANFKFDTLKMRRLEEILTLTENGVTRIVTLRTDLVAFNKVPDGQSNTHLLVYSILDSASPGAKLVTLFPVESAFVDTVLNPRTLGQNMPIITRYNAFVDGVTGQQLKGLRKIAE